MPGLKSFGSDEVLHHLRKENEKSNSNQDDFPNASQASLILEVHSPIFTRPRPLHVCFNWQDCKGSSMNSQALSVFNSWAF